MISETYDWIDFHFSHESKHISKAVFSPGDNAWAPVSVFSPGDNAWVLMRVAQRTDTKETEASQCLKLLHSHSSRSPLLKAKIIPSLDLENEASRR